MLKATVSCLREKTLDGSIYMSIEKPCTGNDYDDLRAITESVVKYWDNMRSRYASSEGCLIPMGYIRTLLDKFSHNMKPISLTLKRAFKMMIYVGCFLATLIIVMVFSYSMIHEDRGSRLTILPLPAVYTVNYGHVVREKGYSHRALLAVYFRVGKSVYH